MRDRFGPSTYIVKQLCQFSESTFNLLDVLVPLLDFPIGSFRLAISIRAHQLQGKRQFDNHTAPCAGVRNGDMRVQPD